MVLPMSRPQKHPKTGVYYFREKVPADLRSAFGKVEVTRTLGTKDPAEAKVRHAEEKRKQALIWQTMRAKPEPIPHKTIMALAGIYYREQIAGHELNPGGPEEWDVMGDVVVDAAEDMAQAERLHGEVADRLLRDAGLVADTESRGRLVDAMNVAYYQATQALKRMAEGDYRPDPKAERFPEPPAKAAETAKQKPTLTRIFAQWEREHLANGKSKKTAADFRHKLDSLREFVGHDDATRVTPEDIVAWSDRLRFTDGLSPRTVANKYLVAVKTVFGLAVQRKELRSNPAQGFTVKVPKAQKVRPKGFTDDEANAILTAALAAPETEVRRPQHTRLALRWLPWIAAYTGARVGELAQLRREDLVTEYGILSLRITPEAGAVKSGNYRLVPLHPHMIEQGLPEFIRSRPDGPLFFPLGDTVEDPVTRAQSIGKVIGKWVHNTVGIGSDVQPNHGWRHRFKTLARDVGIPLEYVDAIQGHEDGRASTGYGEHTMIAIKREVERFPRQSSGST
jgi:integrase